MKFATFLTMLGLLVNLCGCSGGASQVNNTRLQLNPDPATAKLAEAANSASKSLNDLAEIELAVSPPPPSYHPVDPASYGMANLISVDWAGPVETIAQKIANSTGYILKTFGTEPAIPILVFISAKNRPIGDVLRDLGYQVHRKATIVVYPDTRVIELRYASV